jgi:Zn finger protein HypA/HybF involved in hydrogenase expression
MPSIQLKSCWLPLEIRHIFAHASEMIPLRLAILPKDLETPCTQCHYPIPPSEIMHLDFHRMRCPRCLAVFIPEQKGLRQQ